MYIDSNKDIKVVKTKDFKTDFKLFFPQYIPPTPTATPTPIVVSTSSDLIMDNSDGSDGGCNSRGGGPASVGLIILSLAPVYLLNRKRKFK